MDGFLDEVIRATGSGGDADGEVGTGGEPFTGCDFFFGVDVEVPDRVRRVDAVRVADEVGREFLLPDFDEVRGVRAVVAAHYQKEVEGFIEELEQGVLPVLRGAADGVEIPEVCGASGVALGHALAEEVLDRLGLAAEHRCLIRHADALQVEEGIKSRAGGAVEAGEEFAGIAAMNHEIGNGLGVLEIEHNQVMTLLVLSQRARGGGAGFLVRGLAVDDRGHALGGILADALPDAHHIAAGGVDNLAAVGFHRVDHGDLGAERRHDHDILGLEVVEVGIGGMGGQ